MCKTQLPISERLSQDTFPHLHIDHSLDVALRRIADTGWAALPVVSRDNVRQWRGTISLNDILAAYSVERLYSGADTPRPPLNPIHPRE